MPYPRPWRGSRWLLLERGHMAVGPGSPSQCRSWLDLSNLLVISNAQEFTPRVHLVQLPSHGLAAAARYLAA